jgi:hypothetical protein
MTRNVIILILSFLFFMVAGCSDNNVTAEDIGLAGIWEVDLSPDKDVSTFKGKVNFKGNRYVYTWYQLREDPDNRSKNWVPIEMEQGNIVVEKPGVMQLLADSYGVSNDSGDVQNQEVTNYQLEPSHSDYLIHYEIRDKQLVWKEDSNLDGDFEDVFDFPETVIYTLID